MRRSAATVAALGTGLLTFGCGAGDTPSSTSVQRDTLPNGALRVTHRALPPTPADTLQSDLSIGTLDGEPYEVFGDVRGIEARPDGTILVLDYQASEIRSFAPDGGYQGVLARRGQGPGEVTEANGMVLAPDGTLWFQDHSQWLMIGIDEAGEEVDRVPMPVLSYGYIYSGTLDDRGRFWKSASHSDGPQSYPPEEGLNEGSSRMYYKHIDPSTEATDSVFLGEMGYRTFISRNSMGGYSYRGIPHDPGVLSLVDPAGGFWMAHTARYRIAHLDEWGDTALVIEADVPPAPVTAADREAYLAPFREGDPSELRTGEEVTALMPETKPVIDQMFVDDVGRLWVRRVAAEGEAPRYDLFTRSGDFVGSVAFGFVPSPYFPPRVRDGNLYTITLDDLDVARVVRTVLPVFGG